MKGGVNRNILKFSLGMVLSLLLTACSANKVTPVTENTKKAAEYNTQLGIGYLAQGNVQRAKAKLLLALKQAPDWPPALDAMGYFLEKTGEPEEAQKYYLRSLGIAPHDGNVLNNYGAYLCRQKRYSEAEEYFLEAVKDPNYLTISEAYENAGVCLLGSNNDSKAQYYFKKSLLQDPQRTTVIYELAKLTYKQQQYAQAKGYIDNYLSLTQANPSILLLGYQAARKLNDPSAASRYASLLTNNYPDSVEARQLQ